MARSDKISERACHDPLSKYLNDFTNNKFGQVKELFPQSLDCYKKRMEKLLQEDGTTYLMNFEKISSITQLQCRAEV